MYAKFCLIYPLLITRFHLTGILHCHIDWHLDMCVYRHFKCVGIIYLPHAHSGLAIVFAENIPAIAKEKPPRTYHLLHLHGDIYVSVTPQSPGTPFARSTTPVQRTRIHTHLSHCSELNSPLSLEFSNPTNAPVIKRIPSFLAANLQWCSMCTLN